MATADELRALLGDNVTETVVDIGRYVACDWCGEELTDDTRPGGFMFQSKAVGPCCAVRTIATIQGYGEERFITGYCTPGMAFADWVRELRKQRPGGSEIRVISAGGTE